MRFEDRREEMFSEAHNAVQLTFGGITTSYVGFSLSKDGIGEGSVGDLVGMLMILSVFVLLTIRFPRDAVDAEMNTWLGVIAQLALIASLIFGAGVYAPKLGLSGDILIALMAAWLGVATFEYLGGQLTHWIWNRNS